MNEPFRLRYTNQIVGAFLLGILLFLIATSIVLMRAGDFFSTPVSFWIEVPQNEIGDLHMGAEVMMLGQRVGEVRTIQYIEDTEWVQIELAIAAEKSKQITDNSEIQFERKFGVGAPILIIRRSVPDDSGDLNQQQAPLPGNAPLHREPATDEGASISSRENPAHHDPATDTLPSSKIGFPQVAFEQPLTVTLAATRNAAGRPATTTPLAMQNGISEGLRMAQLQRPQAGDEPQRRVLRFRGESDRLDKVAQEVAEVSDSVRRIQEQLKPTLQGVQDAADRFGDSLDQTIDPAFRQADVAFESLENTSETIRPETIRTLSSIQDSTLRLEQQVTDLTDRIQNLVDQDVAETLSEIRDSSDRAALASDSAREAADRAGLAADNVANAADNINDTTDQVNQDIARTLGTLRDAAVQVQRLALETRQVVRIVRGEAEELPGTTERINNTVADTQDLVGEIRGHWLLRNADRSDDSSRQVSPSAVRAGSVR